MRIHQCAAFDHGGLPPALTGCFVATYWLFCCLQGQDTWDFSCQAENSFQHRSSERILQSDPVPPLIAWRLSVTFFLRTLLVNAE